MRAVIQRVKKADVVINDQEQRHINEGLVVLLGITEEDAQSDIDWLIGKIINMRIFSDENGKMNLSIQDIEGSILLVSQFTLYASTKKGNRPSFIKAAKPEVAIPLYEQFIKTLQNETNCEIKTGEFGADMQVTIVNDGPVTILIDSKNKE